MNNLPSFGLGEREERGERKDTANLRKTGKKGREGGKGKGGEKPTAHHIFRRTKIGRGAAE